MDLGWVAQSTARYKRFSHNQPPIRVSLQNSLTKSQAIAVDSPGRSGAKFYQSYDRLFIIKTLLSEEVEQMHVLLKEYHPVSGSQASVWLLAFC